MGPEHDEMLNTFQLEKLHLQQAKMRQDWQDQIYQRDEKQAILDREDKENAAKWIAEDEELVKLQDHEKRKADSLQKERNARAWIQQSNMKYKT